MLSLAKVLIQFSTMMQLEKVHPLQSGLIRMRHPSERRPGLRRERTPLSFYARYIRDLIVRNARIRPDGAVGSERQAPHRARSEPASLHAIWH